VCTVGVFEVLQYTYRTRVLYLVRYACEHTYERWHATFQLDNNLSSTLLHTRHLIWRARMLSGTVLHMIMRHAVNRAVSVKVQSRLAAY
jgi:hypothetical protein